MPAIPWILLGTAVLATTMTVRAELPPTLQIEESDASSVRITWTNAPASFILESVGELSDCLLWQAVTNLPGLSNNENAITLQSAGTTRLFHLYQLPATNLPPEWCPPGDQSVTVGEILELQLKALDPNRTPLSFGSGARLVNATLDSNSGLFRFTPTVAQLGTNEFAFYVTDGSLNATQQMAVVVKVIAIRAVPDAQGRLVLSWTSQVPGFVLEESNSLDPGTGWTEVPMAALLATDHYQVAVAPSPGQRFYRLRLIPVPPDPASMAPALSTNSVTPFLEATKFLYTGLFPAQLGVASNAIRSQQAAVLHGRVRLRDGKPLPAVRVSLLDHPEVGFTQTRADGRFDLAINGGGSFSVQFSRPGYATVQRQMNVPWQDYSNLEDIVMIMLDSTANVIVFGSNAPAQLALSSPQADADGTRQARVYFPAGTCATIVLPNGQTQDCSALTIRVTEFTVGTNGPAAMPASLPPTSAYTYCAEFSADEAYAIGATTIRFNHPVPVYLENFLGLPVGSAIPIGTYDRSAGNWKAGPDGGVLRLLAVNGGMAELDLTGGGTNAPPADLAALGIDASERQRLASMFSVGQSFWRAPVDHFSNKDPNLANNKQNPKATPDVTAPKNGQPQDNDQSNQHHFGTVELPNLVFRETIPLVGVPYSLNYSSDRVPGYRAARQLEIAVTGSTVPAGATSVELDVDVGGKHFETNLPPLPNQFYTFEWDGKDAYGRKLVGSHPASILLGNVFPATGYAVSSIQSGEAFSFARSPNEPLYVSTVRGGSLLFANRSSDWLKNVVHPNSASLGGWTFSVHHAYDPQLNLVYLGDGTRYTPRAPANSLMTLLGGPIATNVADNIPAAQRSLSNVGPLAVAPDGTIYYITSAFANWDQLRKITPGGMDQPVTAYESQYRDALASGGLARQTRLDDVDGLGLGPDGSIYLMEYGTRPGPPAFFISRIRRITPNGVIHDFAGDATSEFRVGFNGDGQPALETQFGYLHFCGFAVAPDGSLYVADKSNWRVRRIGPEGLVFTVAGTGSPGKATSKGWGVSTNGVPATQVAIANPGAPDWGQGLALGPDGSFYFNAYRNILRVTPDGILQFFLGGGPNPNLWLNYDTTGIATDYYLAQGLYSMLVDSDNSLYFSTGNVNDHIMRITSDGTLHPFAGRPRVVSVDYLGQGDGGDPRRAVFGWIRSIARHPDGGILIGSDSEDPPGPRNLVGAIRRAGASFTRQIRFSAADQVVPSQNGSELYQFDVQGRHLATLDSLTFSNRFTFAYDAADRLISVRDRVGNVTTIVRDGAGQPTAIIGPFGQQSALTLDANGFLASVANPAAEVTYLTNSASGLLQSITGPRGFSYQFNYDEAGRVRQVGDPAGGGWTYSRTRTERGHVVTSTSAESRVESHTFEIQSDGTTINTHVATDGTTTRIARRTDNSVTTTTAAGTVITEVRDTDPRPQLGLDYLSRREIKVPGLPTYLLTRVRTILPADAAAVSQVTNVTDVVTINGNSSTSSVDLITRTLTLRSPAGRVRVLQADGLGRVLSDQIPGLGLSSFSYEGRGFLTNATFMADGQTEALNIQYDALGRLTNAVAPEGLTTSFSYNSANRANGIVLPDNQPVGFDIDSEGNLTGLTPPGRPAHRFSYDGRNLLVTNDPPALGTSPTPESFEFTRDRDPLRLLIPGGRSVNWGYNGLGQVTNLAYSSGDIYTSQYHATNGLLTNRTYSAGASLAYQYAGGVLTNTIWSGAVTGRVGLALNADFRITTLRVNNTNLATFKYDADGLLTNAGALAITRDAQSGLISRTALSNVTTTLQRNGFGEVTNYLATFSGTPLLRMEYAYDRAGRITNKVETIQGSTTRWEYGYDAAGRLQQVRRDGLLASSYTYDTNGNRLTWTTTAGSITYHYDAQDRLIDYAGSGIAAAVQHTDAGEWTNRALNGQSTSYRYDEGGGLRQVTLPDTTQIQYALDAEGRRVRRVISGVTTNGWLWLDDLTPVAQLDANDTVRTYFVPGLRVNTPEYLIQGTNLFRVLTDHQGSPRLIVNAANGTVSQRLDYDEFGRVTLDTNPGFQPFAFAGGLSDPATGLVRFGARDYDPETGRWTTKDPIGFAGGDTSLYAYVGGDPINQLDPTGLGPWVETGYKPNDDWNPLRSEDRRIIVRRRGTVVSYQKGSKQPVNIMTNKYAGPGETIETGPDSIVKIGELGGGSVLVGPNARIVLEKGGIRVFHKEGAERSFKVQNSPDADYEVHTASQTLSSRG